MNGETVARRDAGASIDALTHVTPDGRWFDTPYDAGEATLLRQLDAAGVARAAVVALADHVDNDFILALAARHEGRLLPVGGFNPAAWDSPTRVAAEARARLRDAGLVGVKLHPRFHRYDPLDPRVEALLEEASTWNAPPTVWLCTFFHYSGGTLRKGVVDSAFELVSRYPALRFVLAHGGGPDLLRLATAVRHCPNALLDLSFTLVRFAGSSVEVDLRYLLRSFDRRLVFGSDFPEVPIPEARRALERLAADAKPGALQRVLGGNLAEFLAGDAIATPAFAAPTATATEAG